MQAVKAIYKEGKIHLLSPMPAVEEAELLIIVQDTNDGASSNAQSSQTETNSAEAEFQTIGLKAYFDTEEDNQVDWEELFDVKTR